MQTKIWQAVALLSKYTKFDMVKKNGKLPYTPLKASHAVKNLLQAKTIWAKQLLIEFESLVTKFTTTPHLEN